jgi:hypothetical protein
MMDTITAAHDGDIQMIDSPSIRAPRHCELREAIHVAIKLDYFVASLLTMTDTIAYTETA